MPVFPCPSCLKIITRTTAATASCNAKCQRTLKFYTLNPNQNPKPKSGFEGHQQRKRFRLGENRVGSYKAGRRFEFFLGLQTCARLFEIHARQPAYWVCPCVGHGANQNSYWCATMPELDVGYMLPFIRINHISFSPHGGYKIWGFGLEFTGVCRSAISLQNLLASEPSTSIGM